MWKAACNHQHLVLVCDKRTWCTFRFRESNDRKADEKQLKLTFLSSPSHFRVVPRASKRQLLLGTTVAVTTHELVMLILKIFEVFFFLFLEVFSENWKISNVLFFNRSTLSSDSFWFLTWQSSRVISCLTCLQPHSAILSWIPQAYLVSASIYFSAANFKENAAVWDAFHELFVSSAVKPEVVLPAVSRRGQEIALAFLGCPP